MEEYGWFSLKNFEGFGGQVNVSVEKGWPRGAQTQEMCGIRIGFRMGMVQVGRREKRGAGRSGRLPQNATRSCWDSGPPSCMDNHPHTWLPSGQGLNASVVTSRGRGEDSEEKGG